MPSEDWVLCTIRNETQNTSYDIMCSRFVMVIKEVTVQMGSVSFVKVDPAKPSQSFASKPSTNPPANLRRSCVEAVWQIPEVLVSGRYVEASSNPSWFLEGT